MNYGVGTGMPEGASGDTNAGLSRNTGTGSDYIYAHGGDATDQPQEQMQNNRPRPPQQPSPQQQHSPLSGLGRGGQDGIGGGVQSTINPGPDDWLNRDIAAGSANGAKL